MLTEPALFLVFNRPDTTARVFEAIRAARPPRLYVAADGPRPERQGEDALCAETRRIATAVDWPCELKTRFLESNLGCRDAVSSAITWFFENEPEGIILEDDCLPCPDFFRFCQELLERYRHDTRVMHISGDNLQLGAKRGDASYYFARIAHIWGWASWRRAWKSYDVDIKDFPLFRDAGALQDVMPSRFQSRIWLKILQAVYDRKPWFNTWDHQWTYAILHEGGLSISPNVNLVSNLGFKGAGTHCLGDSALSKLSFGILPETLSHPSFVVPSQQADDLICRYFLYESAMKKLRRRLRSLFRLLVDCFTITHVRRGG